MKLNFEKYRDKVYACMIGKNIGGTIGGPYEGKHAVLDIKGFSTDAGAPLPNDDLDLQLLWLIAMEKYGPHNLNANVLADYWEHGITANYNEYGTGKVNCRMGLLPPLSGEYNNGWKDSNGAWIRTEIWACLCPGYPYAAVKYAVEDGMIDHGTGEGTVSAAFVAAMQSAAFIVDDINEAIKIGLAAIPENSRTAQSIRLVYECYEKGMDPIATRNAVWESNKDICWGWMSAPTNIGFAVIGLLYGQGDFKKSMLLAINCGDDTDCTGATVGATLGILGGTKAIPEDWRAHIGDGIVTVCIATGIIDHIIPKTCTELANRITKIAQSVLDAQYNNKVQLHDGEDDIPEDEYRAITETKDDYSNGTLLMRPLNSLIPNSMRFETTAISATVVYDGAPEIAPGEEKKLRIILRNRCTGDCKFALAKPLALSMRWIGCENFIVEGRRAIPLLNPTSRNGWTQSFDVTVRALDKVDSINRLVLEIFNHDMAQTLYVPVTLLGK